MQESFILARHVAEGDDNGEAYTVIIWGVGLSHEILEVAGAEAVATAEGNMCGAVTQGTVALPGSETTSRMNGSRRNLGDLTPPAVATVIPGHDRKSRRRSCWGRREESDGCVVPMKPRTKPATNRRRRVEGRRPVEGKASSRRTPRTQSGAGVSLKRRAYGLGVSGLPSSYPRSCLTFDESPLRESCTVGSVGEVPGNWHLYPTRLLLYLSACPLGSAEECRREGHRTV